MTRRTKPRVSVNGISSTHTSISSDGRAFHHWRTGVAPALYAATAMRGMATRPVDFNTSAR